MSACLLCASPHSTAVFRGSNRLFGVTAGEFAVVRCGHQVRRLLLTHRLSLREVA